MTAGLNRRRLTAGEVLFQTGDSGQEAYLIESGAIEIFQQRDGSEISIARLGRDDLFGEMALVGDHTRTASARADIPTELLVITHELLSDQMRRAPPVLRHLLRVTMARSRDSLRQLDGGPTRTETPTPEFEHIDRDLAVRRLRTEHNLRDALRDQALELHYQPIVEINSTRIAGFESLIRWRSNDGQLIPPSEFVDVAEDSDLIVEIGHWIIDTAAAALQRMNQLPLPERPFCSINLSPRQFSDPLLFPAIRDALQRYQLVPSQLRLEITESMVLGDMAATQALLHQCRALGCPLLVDDFGTGYSSLSYLHQLPVDAIKLDRSFITEITENARATVIVRALALLATDLGMYTVVEGIESEEQAQICGAQGIRYAQGYHFARPMPLDQALDKLRT
ncbi:EAL domain-containing protein [Sinimarinibacterium sp. CAU 1509]|uniref:EAL domain-containing protein n=1 Tax=Sinimarinibacterium sp. CAU 1509 TaxID=2562283 RepID=UPI00146C445F|nr:EAL domain-containing protein [Sinimarinibacterium sp. CAU 1509]